MKKIYLITIILLGTVGMVLAQPTVLQSSLFATATNTTPNSTNVRLNLNPVGSFKQIRFLANVVPGGTNTWAFHQGTALGPDYTINWRSYDVPGAAGPISLNNYIQPAANINAARCNSGGGTDGSLPTFTAGRYYTFNVTNNSGACAACTPALTSGGTCNSMEILETVYNPVTIPTVTAGAIVAGAQTVNITSSATPAAGENIYLRYSTNGYVTSTLIQATGAGTVWTASIPWQTSAVNYYIYTSNKTLAAINSDVSTNGQSAHDMSTLNLNNNAGANYTWTPAVFAGPITVFSTLGTGAGGVDYPSLTLAGGAFAALNGVTAHIGTVNVYITADVLTETGLTPLNASVIWTSVNINPAGGAARTISGTNNGPLIDLNGADNVTLDGLNSGGNALTFSNTNSSGSASTIRFINDASTNTITRCSLLGSSGASVSFGLGIVAFVGGSVTGNDNNTITQCNLSASSGGNPINAIYSMGSSAAIDNSNNTLSINNIADYFNASAASNGLNINSNNSAWTINANTFYQTATRTYTTASTHNGIFITSGSGYTITNNFIGYSAPNQTGTTNMIGLSLGSLGGTFPGSFTAGGTAIALRYNGINCAFTAGGAASSIQNNNIGGIALYTSSGATLTFGILCGIAVTSGNANIGTVTGNIIGSSTGTSSIYAASTTAGGVVSGIYCTSSNTVNIQNNVIAGIDVSGTTATRACGFKGVDASGAGVYNISNNSIGNGVPYNIRTGYLVTGANLSNTATTPTAASGASTITGIISTASGNTVDINSNAIKGIQISGTASVFAGIQNNGAVVSTINMNSNTFGSATADAVTFTNATTGAFTAISNTNGTSTATLNMNGNAFNRIVVVSTNQFSAVTNTFQIDVAVNMNNNQLGTASGTFVNFSGAQNSNFYLIYNNNGTASTTCALTMQANNIQGIVQAVAGTANHKYISSNGTLPFVNILSNTFTNLNVNTTGTIFFLDKSGALSATGISNVNNNSIVGTFNNSGTSGIVTFFAAGNPASVNGATMIETGNNFSNATVAGTTLLIAWQNADGTSAASAPTKTITGNTFNNLTAGTGNTQIMVIILGASVNCSSNTISNINANGSISAIVANNALNAQGTHNYSSNIISNLTSTGPGGSVRGMIIGSVAIPVMNVSANNISGLSSTGASANITGIQIDAGATVNVNDNLISGLSGSGITSPTANGINVLGGTTVNVYRNKISNILESGGISTLSPAVNGMLFSNGTTITAYNNFISDLKATNANLADAIRGVSITSAAAGSTYNLYYNSVYINATSSGTNFGTSGIYHLTNPTATTAALNLIDNIVANTSTPNAAGLTAAYRRSDATLTNFAATSDYNLYFAGTPSATKLIYYDGTNSDLTLASYQTRVSTREASSISVLPVFTSATDLHLVVGSNCAIDGRGVPIATYTTDIDANTRDAGAPDMGADEFTTSPVPATMTTASNCDTKNVSPLGTLYLDGTCNLIAKVLPSGGGTAVNGKIKTCVTLDAVPQTFNAQGYVQRHYDIEPVTSPATATGTITLYFTDAEFVQYNTNNPVYPPMPTNGVGNTAANRNNVRITQYHGVGTGSPTHAGNYPGIAVLIVPGAGNVIFNGSFWEVTFPVSGFSGFYAHTNIVNGPLPIIVNYLTGRRQGSNHLLNWKVTCATSPSATMILERSADGRNYTGINTITADAARCNQPFDYTDANPLIGMNYYRLKIVDAAGKVTYSITVASLNAVKGFDIISIAPNPVVAGNFKLNVASAQAGKMEMVIFDIQGRLVNRQSISLVAGFNSTAVNVANLAAGTYTIKGSMADDQSKLMRFVKQ